MNGQFKNRFFNPPFFFAICLHLHFYLAFSFTLNSLFFSGSDDSFGRQEETTESSFRRRGYTYHGLRHGGGGMHVGSYQYGNFIELGIVLGMFLKIPGKVSLQNYPRKEINKQERFQSFLSKVIHSLLLRTFGLFSDLFLKLIPPIVC